MKCQILFSGKTKKNITDLSFAELALLVKYADSRLYISGDLWLSNRSVFAKTAGLSDKTGKFSFCPAENFSLSDKCPVILAKKKR